MSQQIVMQKAKEVEEITKLLKRYKVLGVASLQKVRAAQLQEFKKKFRNDIHLRVIKNTLMKRAIASCKDKPNLEKLEASLSGSNIFLFTDLSPFRLSIMLQKGRVTTTAKAGDIAAMDVVVPAGNTGLPPGPIISQLGSVGLPTRIEAGSVWVNRDTLVAKKGDIINPQLAGVLSKLAIKSVEIGLILKSAYEDGLVIDEEQLRLDLEEFRQEIVKAQAEAFNLSLNSAYPTSENMELLIQAAHRCAFNLALNSTVTNKETIPHLLMKAHMEMLSLSARLPKVEKTEEKLESEAAPAEEQAAQKG